jgi:hypothetical protein
MCVIRANTAEARIAGELVPGDAGGLRIRTEEAGYELLDTARRLSRRSRVASMTGGCRRRHTMASP